MSTNICKGGRIHEEHTLRVIQLLEIRENAMARRYYSSRNNPTSLTLDELYWKLQHLYLLFRDRDYFKLKANITQSDLPETIKHEAAIALSFQPFPITKWGDDEVTEDHIFDTIEFLYDHVSKPGEWVNFTNGTGWNYSDYDSYDDNLGREEFRQKVNAFLCHYRSGYELTKEGNVLALGADGLQHIIDAKIIPYDEKNVDSKVRHAIVLWRNRQLSLSGKKEAIRELADVFEWLKKTKKLDNVLAKKDDSAIFEIANSFGIRHHSPQQKVGYNKAIWYSWIFHFYLATYHAVVRLLIEQEQDKN